MPISFYSVDFMIPFTDHFLVNRKELDGGEEVTLDYYYFLQKITINRLNLKTIY